MKLLLEKWKRFLNESVVTVDFDNTLKSKEPESKGQPILDVIKMLKSLAKPGTSIHIVSRRRPNEVYDDDFKDAKSEMLAFINTHDLPVEEIHLTSWQNKGKMLDRLGSEIHIDDSEKTWRELEKDYPNIKLIKVNKDTGEIMNDLNEESKPNPWAICTASVGRKDKAKYERCVLKIKDQHGIKK